MAGEAGYFKSFGVGPKTASAGTAIVLAVKGLRNKKTKICSLQYTSAGTAHTLTVLRPLAWTTLTAAAAASQAVVAIARDPGAYAANAALDGVGVPSVADNVIAASDYVAVQLPDGNLHVDLVSSVSTLNITLTNNLPAGGAASGARFWFFGVIGDTDPNTGLVHPAFAPTTSATTTFSNVGGGSLLQSIFDYSPLLCHSGNATAAGTIQNCGGVYAK